MANSTGSGTRPRLVGALIVGGLLLGLALVGGRWLAARGRAQPEVGASVVEALSSGERDGYDRAWAPRRFDFPADSGPHPRFQTEWWYYTGNLSDESGRRFGYQLTFFRRALRPLNASPTPRTSAWAATQIFFAHFALSDIADRAFYPSERFSRAALELAGAQAVPFRVWLDDWTAEASTRSDGSPATKLRASEGGVAIELDLSPEKPVALHGDRGLSQKSAEPGNASYYYSQSRLATRGTVTVRNRRFTVAGTSWLDREWSTSALSPAQSGWDWFALQLDDGRELMLYQLRRRDGTIDPASSGSLIERDGQVRALSHDDLQIVPSGHWQSPHTGARYPAGWKLRIAVSPPLELEVTPLQADQELPLRFSYWEGAVAIRGTARGYGYVELTGYAESPSHEPAARRDAAPTDHK